ncbi:MAG: hypothetical protein ABIJ21_07105 [Nanoarchaeota archaeon]
MADKGEKTSNCQSDLEAVIRHVFSSFIEHNAEYIREITSRNDFNATCGGIVPRVQRLAEKLSCRAEPIANRFGTSPEYVREVIDDWYCLFHRGEFYDVYQQ